VTLRHLDREYKPFWAHLVGRTRVARDLTADGHAERQLPACDESPQNPRSLLFERNGKDGRMQKLLTVLTILSFSVAVVGCGGETPKPPTPNTDTDLGPTGAIESGSDTGPSGALPPAPTPTGEATPAATTPDTEAAPAGTPPAGDQQAVEGESASAEGPSLPDPGT
jgi:hypothetical protein